jgi:hypothetical protein
MQYYTFTLDEESKDLTTIITPFGKYQYNVLPMSLKCLSDFTQETMENIFHNIDDAEVYIIDIGAFSPNWEHHLKLLCTILTKLQENGFTVNPLICNWAVTPLTLQTGAPKKGQTQQKICLDGKNPSFI